MRNREIIRPREKIMKLRIIIFTLVILGTTYTFAKTGKKSSKYQFKIATLAPDRSVWLNTYKAMADEIFDATAGEVKFKCYPGGIQGDEVTVLRKIRIGQLQGSGLTGNGLAMICQDSLVFQLPILFRSEEEVDFVFSKMIPLFAAQCKENGFEVLGWPHLGFSYLFSKNDIQDIPSLRASKPWLLENDIISKAFFNASGVSAVPANVSDVLTGLRSGLIHTVFSPPVGMISLQWFSRIESRLDLKLIYSFGAFVVTQKKWNRVPRDIQEKIKGISQKHFDELNSKIRQQNHEALLVMEKKKIKTVSPSPQGLEEFHKISGKVADQLAGNSFSRKSLSLMNSLLSEFRKNNKPND